MDYRLHPHETVAGGCRRVACEEIAIVLQQLHECAAADDPAPAVHQARRHLKKLRALLRLLRPAIGDTAFARENRCFRRAGRRLSQARDAEVCLQTLRTLEADAGAEAQPALAATEVSFADLLGHHRRPAQRTLDAVAASLVKAAARVGEWSFEAEGWDALEPGFARLCRRERKASKRAAKDATVEELHTWRKRVKDLGAAFTLLRDLQPEETRLLRKSAKTLADLLGADHDLAVLRETLRDERTPRPVGKSGRRALSAKVEGRRRAVQEEAMAAGKSLRCHKPKKMTRQFGRWWRNWHVAA